jgi:hypothetical protein
MKKEEDVQITKYPYFDYEKKEKTYCIRLLTGDPCFASIEVYFDKRKRLRYMTIDPHYFIRYTSIDSDYFKGSNVR